MSEVVAGFAVEGNVWYGEGFENPRVPTPTSW